MVEKSSDAKGKALELAPPSPIYPAPYVEPVRRRAYVYREASDSLHLLYEALSRAQGEIGTIPKRHRSHYGAYADLADIREFTHKALSKHGLTVHQTLQLIGGDQVLVTTLGHSSGQWLNSVSPIKAASNPQQTAAAVTYARRMALSALLNLATEEEDDGEAAAVAAATSAPQGGLFAKAKAAILTCQNRTELKAKVGKAMQCQEQGQLNEDEVEQLLSLADEMARKMPKGGESDVE